jgi:hypothetical protein
MSGRFPGFAPNSYVSPQNRSRFGPIYHQVLIVFDKEHLHAVRATSNGVGVTGSGGAVEVLEAGIPPAAGSPVDALDIPRTVPKRVVLLFNGAQS